MATTVRHEPEVMSKADAARTCGVSVRTMRRWTALGLVETVVMPSGREAVLIQGLHDAVRRIPHDRRKRPRP